MRKRPSRLWLWFWGKKRRGWPGLLTVVVLAAIAGAVAARSTVGYDVGYWFGVALIVLLTLITLGALAAAIAGVLRPRGRR